MTACWAGVDVGGSKTQLRIEDPQGRPLFERQWPTGPWSGEPYSDKARRMTQLITQACMQAKLSPPIAVGIGAHGCDTQEECNAMTALMANLLPASVCQVVNDAALVALCAQGEPAAGLIAGTGSVAIARGADGAWLQSGGWGWIVGDEGGAGGLVRIAIGAVLQDWDRGRQDDPLTTTLVQAFGVTHLLDLPSQLLQLPVRDWSRHAPLIFDCLLQESQLARQVVDAAVVSLASLVLRLRERGARFTQVIAAGGVIQHQPVLFHMLADRLHQHDKNLTLSLLDSAPVTGAVALARHIAPDSLSSPARGE